MSLADIIFQRSLNLPESRARQVLDFIEFLELRYPSNKSNVDTEAFLAAIAGGLGKDFPDDINDDDLGVDSPRESLD
jgi:hypothetical protein